MQLIGGAQYDPGKGPGKFPTGIAARGGMVILHNMSPYELLLTFNEDRTRTALLMAWQPRKFDFCGKQTDSVSYQLLPGIGQPAIQQNAIPSSVLWGEAYMPGEPVPDSMPNYDRLSNVGNPSLAITTPSINNQGNPPGYPIIQATPSDETGQTITVNNDGSIQWLIRSVNVLLNMLTTIRGSATAHGQIILGDAQDPSMLVMHGQADNAAQAGQANTANTAQVAKQVQTYDGSLGNLITVTEYEGTVDPSTYLTPSVGDRWYQG